jgi:hypothetical protein
LQTPLNTGPTHTVAAVPEVQSHWSSPVHGPSPSPFFPPSPASPDEPPSSEGGVGGVGVGGVGVGVPEVPPVLPDDVLPELDPDDVPPDGVESSLLHAMRIEVPTVIPAKTMTAMRALGFLIREPPIAKTYRLPHA